MALTVEVQSLDRIPDYLRMTSGIYQLWRSDDAGLMRTTTGAVCYRWVANP